MTLFQNLVEYLAEITGAEQQVKDLERRYDGNMPLFFKAMYKLYTVNLCGRSLFLALQTAREKDRTPAEYEGHLDQLRVVLQNNEVALVLPDVPAYVRNRLIQKKIPFIVPKRQMFLPMFLLDLRERFPERRMKTTAHVSWAAQAVVLYHVLKKPAMGMSLRQLAEMTGYSAMTISNVAGELGDLNVCEILSSGKNHNINFISKGRDLWNTLEPRFRAPNIRKRWVKAKGLIKGSLPSGLTALSSLTAINDDAVPTVALRDKDYLKLIESGEVAGCHSVMDADTGVECWGYDPNLLIDGKTVDRLSLYLSLRDMKDERVRKELRIMMEGIEW